MPAILSTEAEMAKEEKTAWIMLLVTIGAYAIYLELLFSRVGNGSLVETPYRDLMLWTIVGSIAANIVLSILVSIVSHRDGHKKDQRDREIYRFAEYAGQAFIVIGGVSALLMATYKFDYFWIANVIYLGFVLSAILSSIAKIMMYRRGVPRW